MMRKMLKGLMASVMMMGPASLLLGQDGQVTTIYENREEFVHLDVMSNGNLLVSGKSHELGNKSDLVLLLDPQGKEVKRVNLCPSCEADIVYYSRETLENDIIHVRSNGDVYVSDLELDNSEFQYNIAEDQFESIQTYQVLENNNWIIVVSYAVENSVRGLLHTVIDTRSKAIFSQKFNVEFPDIAGSIGIDIFDDQSVIDGFNSFVSGHSFANLIRLGRDRSQEIWQTELSGEDILLEDAEVARSQDVYAVGTIQDAQDPAHRQGMLIKLDEDGNQEFIVTYDADRAGDEAYENVSKNFLDIRELQSGNFLISGFDGGTIDGENVSKAIFMEVDAEGDFIRGFSETALTLNNIGTDFALIGNKFVYVGNAYNNSSNSGAFITVSDLLLDVDDVSNLPAAFMTFANPARDVLVVQIPVEMQLQSPIEVYDYAGNRMISSADKQIDISSLSSGNYLVSAIIDGYKVTQKLVKI
jgi:hypothetical protein